MFQKPKIKDTNEKISVWLDSKDSGTLKKFYCIYCGKVVFEYYDSVKIIVPGGHQIEAPKVIQCKGAKQKVDITGEHYTTRCKAKYYVR